MYTLHFVSIALLLTTAGCTTMSSAPQSKAAVLNWSSDEGITRLAESKHKVDFFKLANHFEGQTNKIFCGPTSAAIVLNAMRVRRGKKLPHDPTLLDRKSRKYLPKRKGWSPFYERYTQNNVLLKGAKTREQVLGKPASKDKKQDFGFQIRQLHTLMLAHQTKAILRVVAADLPDTQIRQEMIANLKTADDYIIVNYKRTVLDQPGGGHISPVGAYHAASDSFLVLDVTPNKADWVWVQAPTLIKAMRTHDTVENRGYLLVSEKR